MFLKKVVRLIFGDPYRFRRIDYPGLTDEEIPKTFSDIDNLSPELREKNRRYKANKLRRRSQKETNKMDYTALLLTAFKTDLAQRQEAGASDVAFDGLSGKMEIRYQNNQNTIVEDGIPPQILRGIVEAIFGIDRKGTITWSGFRMTSQVKHSGENMVDHLVVRLTSPEIADAPV